MLGGSSLMRRLFIIIGLMLWSTVLTRSSLARTGDNTSAPLEKAANNPPNDPALLRGDHRGVNFLTDFEQGLTIVIVIFGSLTLLVEYMLLRNREFSMSELLPVFGVTLIVIGTLVLISAGYDAQQIAPATGLFGTIAGYLLGRRSGREDEYAGASKGRNRPKKDESTQKGKAS
jgi:hypothetical protein